jgi:dimeric dUTPase (all-alpha-NTP-PPase superfamily)
MVKIQNLKDIHAWKVDVLQNQISWLISNLHTLTPFDAWRKRPMTTIKQSDLEELESEHRCYEYHEHQYAQWVYDEL